VWVPVLVSGQDTLYPHFCSAAEFPNRYRLNKRLILITQLLVGNYRKIGGTNGRDRKKEGHKTERRVNKEGTEERERLKSWSWWLRHRVAMWYKTDVSEGNVASNLRVGMVVRNVGILLHDYTCHTSENGDLKRDRLENPKSRIGKVMTDISVSKYSAPSGITHHVRGENGC
jgi:hypothetical protein